METKMEKKENETKNKKKEQLQCGTNVGKALWVGEMTRKIYKQRLYSYLNYE